MSDNEEGFSILGESLARIGRVVREVETNSGIGPPEHRRKRGLRTVLEGVFTEDLAACDDPNVPTTAKFQIKTLVRADNSWANEDSPSIVPVLNRTGSSWSEGDIATIEELYPDKYFVRAVGGTGGVITFMPFDIVPGIGSICDAVVATVLTSACGSSLLPGDEVNVWDRSRSWFAMPEPLLFASSGYAHYMKVSDAERYALGDLDPGPCRWEVVSMNCIEDDSVVY